MKPSGIISLLTDFGHADGYVAAMKAVILSINPQARVIDISHDVAPQNVQAAAFLLSRHSRFFPTGTVHVAVVDPGVGTERRLLAVEAGEQIYLAPDNGLLDFCLELRLANAVVISNSRLWRSTVSTTFHGRDILAPVAAHLSAGVPLAQVGEAAKLVKRLPANVCSVTSDAIHGKVVYVDRFGNLITNIRAADLAEVKKFSELEIFLENHEIGELKLTYADAPLGSPVAVIGSFEVLEISVNGCSAADHFRMSYGATVVVTKKH